jgi:hypothetical protein
MGAAMQSGSGWIDTLFYLCVQILLWLAGVLGVSYNEVNIWIFCIIWPIVTIILIAMVWRQWITIRKLRNQLGNK